MLARSGRTIPLTLTFLALSSAGSAVRAQGNVFNPYGNSGYADYREFTTPMSSNDPSLPGQARLQNEPVGGRNRANQFESYANTLTGRDAELTDGTRNGRAASRPGVPYYQAFRQYDEQYKRVYRPNNTEANRKFDDRMKQRNAVYAEALREPDPVKRARMLRQIEQAAVDRPPASRAPATASTRPAATRPARPSASAAPAASGVGMPAPGIRSSAPARTASPSPAAASPAPGSVTTPPSNPASNPASIPIPPPQ